MLMQGVIIKNVHAYCSIIFLRCAFNSGIVQVKHNCKVLHDIIYKNIIKLIYLISTHLNNIFNVSRTVDICWHLAVTI
jgi:hypothetical protein